MAIIADACPDIERMIFKFNPEYFSNYLQVVIRFWNVYTQFIEIFQLTVFEKLRHFETWGGEFQASGLSHLLEIMGQRLEVLHLCHVEEIGFDDLIQITKCCRYYSMIGWTLTNWDEILCQEFEKPYHRKLQLQYWWIRTEWRKFVHQKHASSHVTWIENVQSDQHSIGDGNDDS